MTTDLLSDDHAEVDALFRELWRAFDRGSAREVHERLDYLWARLAVHIRAEHLRLFPSLMSASARARDGGAGGAPTEERVRAAVERLREDHDFFMRELAAAVNEARELAARGEPADRVRLPRIGDKVRAVAARLTEHNRVEETEVYLWPAALLAGDELEALREGLRREVGNLPPRFSVGGPR